VLEEALKTLERFGVPSEIHVASAHRQPKRLLEIAAGLEERGVEVVIAGAGYAAHLAGVLAAHLILPVIAVPIASSTLGGLDSLLSMAQMPGGVPVATVTIGPAGARNAAVLAVQILARKEAALREKLRRYKAHLAGEGTFP
jgi:5-(carboxyamino)imidazole ribonucleotide mutase